MRVRAEVPAPHTGPPRQVSTMSARANPPMACYCATRVLLRAPGVDDSAVEGLPADSARGDPGLPSLPRPTLNRVVSTVRSGSPATPRTTGHAPPPAPPFDPPNG